MKVVAQRVTRAAVRVEGEVVGAIGRGVLLLVGIERGDRGEDVESLAERIALLRFFPDDRGRMNRSLIDVGGAALVVSQFTLCADLRKGRRPSFDDAEEPARAREQVERFRRALERLGVATQGGRFGAAMAVELENDGPVTFVLEPRPSPQRPT
ncbi:MAG: D-tyrosyl-tRNA(Tyr) deacylase [Planctomycetes bacterium]|nr:D-tyrosyl-tRNA(Tyr) deacylase [Planctomycetota bacterium]